MTDEELELLPELDITVPSGLGHAVVRLAEDGTRVVQHADPTIRIKVAVLDAIQDGEMDGCPPEMVERDGIAITLDTAGAVRYRLKYPAVVGFVDHGVYVRVDGPDDWHGENYDAGGRDAPAEDPAWIMVKW